MDSPLGEVSYGLHAGFIRSSLAFPERPALDVDGEVLSYAQLRAHAQRLASAIVDALPAGSPRLVGVMARRSVPVYEGLLGTLMSGCAVVPLNPGFPAERSRQMIQHAGLRALVLDSAAAGQLDELLSGMAHSMLVLLPQAQDCSAQASRWPQHRFLAADALASMPPRRGFEITADAPAYLFYTSGSTGHPKGVGVLHRNAVRFVEMSLERYADCGVSEIDRFSQFYDITFDSSMFDLYVCWSFGACLCCPSTSEWVNPNKYIEAKALTVIDIVPSAGRAMNRAGGWRAGRFRGLRLCRFGGEALSSDLAAALALAAPGAVIDNVYGPTECTVDAAYYRWRPGRSENECEHGVVPIGQAGPQVRLIVVDSELREVAPGEEGELLIGGPQVTPGYWRDGERTAAAFIHLPGRDGVLYRTGDLVRRPDHAHKPITFLGRLDHQIKIAGVRIELGEVEQVLREVAAAELAVCLGWPLTSSGAAGIVAYITAGSRSVDLVAIRDGLKSRLPLVMVPREIHVLDDVPLNVNGKVDRKALLARLQATSG